MEISTLVNMIDLDTTPGTADYATSSSQPSMTTPTVAAATNMIIVGSCICLVC